jgi:hypothetical protein
VRSFYTSVTPDFFKSRALIATHHLSREYPVYSGMSVSRASSSVMVSLKDPAFRFQNAICHIIRTSTLLLIPEGLQFLWSDFIQGFMFSRFAILPELLNQLLSVLIHLLGGS